MANSTAAAAFGLHVGESALVVLYVLLAGVCVIGGPLLLYIVVTLLQRWERWPPRLRGPPWELIKVLGVLLMGGCALIFWCTWFRIPLSSSLEVAAVVGVTTWYLSRPLLGAAQRAAAWEGLRLRVGGQPMTITIQGQSISGKMMESIDGMGRIASDGAVVWVPLKLASATVVTVG